MRLLGWDSLLSQRPTSSDLHLKDSLRRFPFKLPTPNRRHFRSSGLLVSNSLRAAFFDLADLSN